MGKNGRTATFLTIVIAWSIFCAAQKVSGPDRTAETRIDGAGSTTINPLLSAWIEKYRRQHQETRIQYQSNGSNGGIRALIAGQTSFAASEWPMTDEQQAKTIGRILHFPVALHGIVPVYNLAQVSELRFSGDTLANIFLGRITKWDDPAIATDNPGVALPRMDIKVVHLFPVAMWRHILWWTIYPQYRPRSR